MLAQASNRGLRESEDNLRAETNEGCAMRKEEREGCAGEEVERNNGVE